MKKLALTAVWGLNLLLTSQGFATVDTVWSRRYGSGDYGMGIARDTLGGIIVVDAEGGPINATCVVIKYKPSGDTVWLRKYNNSNDGGCDGPQGVAVDKFGNIYVVGYCYPGGFPNMTWFVLKFKPNGDTVWSRRYSEGDHGDVAWAVAVDTSGQNIYVTGFDASYCVTIKYSSLGDTLWRRIYTGMAYGNGVAVDDSGYAYVVDDWIKYSPAGNLIGSFSFGPILYGVALDKKGLAGANVYAAGSGTVAKFSPQGATLWSRPISGASLWGIAVDSTGNSYTIGDDNSIDSFQTVKHSPSGDSLWSVTYFAGNQCTGEAIVVSDSGNFYVTGWSGSDQLLTIKYHETSLPSGAEGEKGQSSRLDREGVQATPNPFVSFASVPGHERESFALYDITGRQVGTYRGDRIGEGLAPGVYFLKGEDKAGKLIRVVKVR